MTARDALALALVLVAGLAGCGDGPHQPARRNAQTSSSPGSTDALPGSTPTGTHLRLGQEAVITVGQGDGRSRIGVVVTGVDKGSSEDVAALLARFADALRVNVPDFTASSPVYFIRGILINQDGMNGGSYSGPLLNGDLDGGGDAGQLQIIGFGGRIDLPHCTVELPPPQWSAKGARLALCRIIFAHPNRVRLSAAGGDIYWDLAEPPDSTAHTSSSEKGQQR